MKTPKRHINRSYNYNTASENTASVQSYEIIFNQLSDDQIKISQLPETSGLDGVDLLPIVDISGASLVTKKITLSNFIDNTFNTSILPSGDNIKFNFNNNTLYIYTSPTGDFVVLKQNGVLVSVSGHSHISSDISNFASSVSGLIPLVTGTDYVNSVFNNNLYSISVTGLQPSGDYSLAGHSHIISDISGLQNVLDGKQTKYPIVVQLDGVSGTINTNASLGDIFDLTLIASGTLANPTNPTDGQSVKWRISHGGSGLILNFGDQFRIPSSATSPLPVSSTSGSVDILDATYDSSRIKWDIITFVPGY